MNTGKSTPFPHCKIYVFLINNKIVHTLNNCCFQQTIKLFSLLKNSKQESKGTAPLKKDGKLYSDTVDKANILNSQFQSVFTPKSPLKLSQLAYMSVQDLSDRGVIDPSQVQGESLSSTPHMESISISVNGIAKLLKDLNPH